MQDFVPIDTEETDTELQVDISCYPGYLGSDDLDGGLYLVKELSAFERFNFSKYMLEMEANEIIQLSLFCNSKNIKVIVREGYSVGEIIDQLPAIEVHRDNSTGSKYFSQMMTSSHEVTTRRSDVSKELYLLRQAAYAIDMIPWKGDPRKKPKLQTVQLALNAIKK